MRSSTCFLNKCVKSWACISKRTLARNEVKPDPIFNFCSYIQVLQGLSKVSKPIPLNFRETFGKTTTICENNIYVLNEIADTIECECNDLNEMTEMINNEKDVEFKDAASKEAALMKTRIRDLRLNFIDNLSNMQIPIEIGSKCDEAIIEVYAGVGGSESMIFAEEIMTMYKNWCRVNGFDFTYMETDEADTGIRKAVASISGSSTVYELLKTEGGVHRVQRVPKTEKRGRMHTSTASVAILPAEEELDSELNMKELIIKPVRKAAGGGGQHVNKTESAIRITHVPTGFVVECNSSRHQELNLEYAKKRMKAKLVSTRNSQLESDVLKARKQQIKNNERSDKLRTYNFQQDEVTDHRINKSVNGVERFLSGGECLTQFMKEVAGRNSMIDLNSTIDILLKEGEKLFPDEWKDVISKANLLTKTFNST